MAPEREAAPESKSHPAGRRAAWIALLLAAGCATSPYERGLDALEAGQRAGAIDLFTTSMEAGEDVFESTRERGAARLEAGDFSGALEDLERARTTNPEDGRLLWLLATAYGREADARASAGDHAAAADLYRKTADACRTYGFVTTRRSVRKHVRRRLAELEAKVAEQSAAVVTVARRHNIPPNPGSVAVYAFERLPGATEELSQDDEKLCRALNVWVTADLTKVSGIEVIAAYQLDLIFRERQMTYRDRQLYDPATRVASAEPLVAEHMVKGVFGSFPHETAGLGAACFDTETVQSSACSDLEGKKSDLFDLETRLVLEILASVGVEPTEEERKEIDQKPTRSYEAFYAYADGLMHEEEGRYSVAAEAFRRAASIDPGFQMALQAAERSAYLGNPSAPTVVPPPRAASPGRDRARRSAGQLGIGLMPDNESGDAMNSETGDVVVVHGRTTITVTATVR